MPSFNRAHSFTSQLSTDKEDVICDLITLNKALYAFTSKKIYRILTADEIDPGRSAPETRHANQEIHPTGCCNPVVARTIIQANRILNDLAFNQPLDKAQILDAAWEAARALLACENAQYRIYEDVVSKLKECDQSISRTKGESSIGSLPQVADLEEWIASFFGNGKRFLEKAHALLSVFYGAPDYDSNFQGYRDWIKGSNGCPDRILTQLEGDKDWIRLVAHARNALPINHSRPGFIVEVRNFALQPGNKFSSPSWRYDLSERGGPTQSHWSDIIPDMDTHMHNMLTFFEELFIQCVFDRCDQSQPFRCSVARIRDDDIDPKCPVLYAVNVTHSDPQPQNLGGTSGERRR